MEPSQITGRPKSRRWVRILRRVFISLLVVALLLVFGVFPYLFARLVTGAGTRPMDRELTETPSDFGAEYTDVEFTTADGVRISGWLLPSGDKKTTIVYSHGLFRSRRELLERAVDLWRLGYGALLYDSRNHGASGAAVVTIGYNERLDAKAAVAFLKENTRSNDRVVLFGISMGAVAALLAAAETPEVPAAVADSSFLSFEDTTDHHIRAFLNLPAFPIANELRFFISQRGGFDSSRLDALEAVKQLGERPVFFISAAHDRRMPPEVTRQLREASQNPLSDMMIVDGPGSEIHGHAYQASSGEYIRRIDRFLQTALSPASQ